MALAAESPTVKSREKISEAMPPQANPFHILGAGIQPEELIPSYRRLIQGADVLVGGRRLLRPFAEAPGRKITLKPPLEEVLQEAERCRQNGKRVVFLADGDPGYFGIGKRMIRTFGADQVLLYPNITVPQAAAARLKLSWDEVQTVSLHGRRDPAPLFQALSRHRYVGVYTDNSNTPAAIAASVLSRAGDAFTVHVLENLGLPEERVSTLSLSAAAGEAFAELNFVVLERTAGPQVQLTLGTEDSCFLHSRGMITKKEIRVAGLAALNLLPGQVVWDLGSGSGSVALEASLLARGGRIVALEKDPQRAEQIRENVRRSGALCVEVVQGGMPECLAELPAPDRVFVGGGLGEGDAVLRAVMERIKPGGRIVLHIVLLGSLHRATRVCREYGLQPEVAQLQVNISEPLARDLRFKPLNPVYIVTIRKPECRNPQSTSSGPAPGIPSS